MLQINHISNMQTHSYVYTCVLWYIYIDRYDSTKDERSYVELYHCEEFRLHTK